MKRLLLTVLLACGSLLWGRDLFAQAPQVIVGQSTGSILHMTCDAGCTTTADGSTFTQGTTNLVPVGGLYTTSWTNITSGKVSVWRLGTDGSGFVNVATIGGTAVSTGNGVSGAGVQRVTIASDSTGQVSVVGTLNTNLPQVTYTSGNPVGPGVEILASDGTNNQIPRVFDADSGAGTQYVQGVVLRQSASGGSVELGTTANPLNANVSQINGVTPTMGNGVSGTGVQRVTIASDSTGQIGLASGSSVIATQTTGTNLHMVCDSGCAGTGGASQNDNTTFTYGTTAGNPMFGVYNATITAATTGRAGALAMTAKRALFSTLVDSGDTDMTDTTLHALKVATQNGSNTVTDAATQTVGATSVASTEAYHFGYDSIQARYARVYVDPCQANAKTRFTINQIAGAQVITGVAAKKTYICDLDVVTATAQNLALVEGTGVVCATGIAGMAGGTTAATGWNFAANGGLVKGNGAAYVYSADSVAADNVCLLQSGTGQVSGSGHYVQE